MYKVEDYRMLSMIHKTLKTFLFLISVLSFQIASSMDNPDPIVQDDQSSEEVDIKGILASINAELATLLPKQTGYNRLLSLKAFEDDRNQGGNRTDLMTQTLEKVGPLNAQDYNNLEYLKKALEDGKTPGSIPIYYYFGYTALRGGEWRAYSPENLQHVNNLISLINTVLSNKAELNPYDLFPDTLSYQDMEALANQQTISINNKVMHVVDYNIDFFKTNMPGQTKQILRKGLSSVKLADAPVARKGSQFSEIGKRKIQNYIYTPAFWAGSPIEFYIYYDEPEPISTQVPREEELNPEAKEQKELPSEGEGITAEEKLKGSHDEDTNFLNYMKENAGKYGLKVASVKEGNWQINSCVISGISIPDPILFRQDSKFFNPSEEHLDLPPGVYAYPQSCTPWLQNLSQSTQAARGQGFKIHVSAKPETAHMIAEIVLPLLIKMRVNFKAMYHLPYMRYIYYLSQYRHDSFLIGRNNQSTQAGKFIVIYPKDPAQTRQILQILDNAFKEHNLDPSYFEKVPGDAQVGKSGGLFVRYGQLSSKKYKGRKGITPVDEFEASIRPDLLKEKGIEYNPNVGLADERIYPWPDFMNIRQFWNNLQSPFEGLDVFWVNPYNPEQVVTWENRPPTWKVLASK